MLTIAIPTYNRNQILLDNLCTLLPQMTGDCKLLLIDNCSATPVADTVQPLLDEYPSLNYELVRNKSNIGANANILRCFELCETDWIWIMGDDDTITPDAMVTVFNYLHTYPEAIFINFAFDEFRKQVVVTHGIEQFVEELDYSANLPWISNSVYKARILVPNLRFGYQYAYSSLPHLATLLISIGESSQCCFCPGHIVDITRRVPPVDQQYSHVTLALGYPVLFDLPLRSEVRELLAKKLLVTSDGPSIWLRGLVYELLLMAIRRNDRRTGLYLYDQICARGYYFDRTFKRRSEIVLYRVLMQFPNIGRVVVLLFSRLRGSNLGRPMPTDWYRRM